ncbi:tachylectin-related carbohydrate-binding protein [Actinosynnema sp. NPDC047251]|uniref:tachylectin-related carbohydrate-binding protein n=1 Tax=Saccharothrix espanaensis TaxID=103731 RepID=UPI0006856FF1|nr:tachylectin-related carbohydrate-binding protein [Saccharothrix espanaensis]
MLSIPTAHAVATLNCNSAVQIFGVTPSGSVFRYPHNDPENGTFDWGVKQNGIGSGWEVGRTLAGPGGVMYSLVGATGELRRLRWTENGWVNFGSQQYRVVGSGWGRYSEAAHRNKVTVDEKGRLYEINADGHLEVFVWEGDDATGWWTAETGGGKVLDTGWNQYDSITAAGDGVLYARKPTGELYRFRYHAASDRFTQYAKPAGVGWNMFNRIFSPGGDVLYATWLNNNNPEMLWYRYDEATDTWADTGRDVGKLVGHGWWGELDVVATTDDCRITGHPAPTRPAVPQRLDAGNTVRQGPDGKVSWFYTNPAGGLSRATQRYTNDFSVLEYQAFTGHSQFTGQPGAALRQDGRFEVLGNSSDDAEYRGRVQQVKNGAWGTDPVTAQRGWMLGDPVLVEQSDATIAQYAVDGSGGLWRRAQIAVNGAYNAWQPITASGLTTDITVARKGTGTEIAARFTDGSVRVARYDGALSAWRTVGTGTTGRPALVVHQGGDLQVFARGTGGIPQTQRETSGAFPGTWTAIGSLATTGSPAAVLTGNGLVELAVRGTDNHVYQASQLAPAAGFSAWQIKYWEETATDPTGLTLADGNPIFTWRSPQGVILTSYISTGSLAARVFTGTAAKR